MWYRKLFSSCAGSDRSSRCIPACAGRAGRTLPFELLAKNDGGGPVIRIALAGCGEHSRTSHATPLARYASQHPDEIELVAACDLSADKATEFCRSFGFLHPYTNL